MMFETFAEQDRPQEEGLFFHSHHIIARHCCVCSLVYAHAGWVSFTYYDPHGCDEDIASVFLLHLS